MISKCLGIRLLVKLSHYFGNFDKMFYGTSEDHYLSIVLEIMRICQFLIFGLALAGQWELLPCLLEPLEQ